MADAVAGFLCRYLACGPHQAACLAVRSPEPQCGKSLCLELLELLCDAPWRAAGADPRTLANHLLTGDTRIRPEEDFVRRPPYTILLDDCHHAFHGSERQPLVALLNSGAPAAAGGAARWNRLRERYLSPSPCSTTDSVSATEITAIGVACSAKAD